jgi:hypothetical protein
LLVEGQFYFSLGIAAWSVLLIMVATSRSVVLFPRDCKMLSLLIMVACRRSVMRAESCLKMCAQFELLTEAGQLSWLSGKLRYGPNSASVE